MSEEKLIKHTRKAVDTITNKHLTWKGKIKEIALEIAIIVFAVSITLILHNWNDHRHEQKMERAFLAGIREDLKAEANNIETIMRDFQPTLDYYNTVEKQIDENKIDREYVNKNSHQLTNTLYFVFDNSRFESFKSSGYLRLIENQELLKNLVTLYTIYFPFHQNEIDKNLFQRRAADYDIYVGVKGVIDSSGTNLSTLMSDPSVKYQIIKYARSFNERKEQQKNLINATKDMIAEIEKELNQ